jgi:hypothetical protein
MKKPPIIVLHGMLWAATILLLAWLSRDAEQSRNWLFCVIALWCCSHCLLQYGLCRRKPSGTALNENNKDFK